MSRKKQTNIRKSNWDYFIILRPTYDRDIAHLTNAGDQIVDYLKKTKYKRVVRDYKRQHVIRSKFLLVLKKLQKKSVLLMLYGHDHPKGRGDGFKGSLNKYVLDLFNTRLLKNFTVIANVCYLCKKHGVQSVEDGVRTYFGYTNELWFPPPKLPQTGFKEIFNKLFFEIAEKNHTSAQA
ncbi:unnamed protein product, partial [marine sediment metagenome]